jgi:hypothetical protein
MRANTGLVLTKKRTDPRIAPPIYESDFRRRTLGAGRCYDGPVFLVVWAAEATKGVTEAPAESPAPATSH